MDTLDHKEPCKAGTYYVKTYGCQMNEYDSEIIVKLLEDANYAPALDMDQADVVVFNTCCIRDNADNKVYGRVGDFKNTKVENPHQIVVVAGCLAQKDKEKLISRFPQIDVVLGTHQVKQLPECIREIRSGKKHVLAVEPKGDHLDLQAEPSKLNSAMVPVSVGCNQWCSYCIVPYVRGTLKSRPLSWIVTEVVRLARSGYKEITLLGQNVNDYGRDFNNGTNFATLIKALSGVPSLKRLRYTSPHPAYFTYEAIRSLVESPSACEHVHLPLQAGDDEVLAVMKRGYTAKSYIQLTKTLRDNIKDLGITTDIIVGFPGETEEQFQHTLDVVRTVRFDSAFMFAYSPRPGTPGALMKNQVPEEEKFDRLYRLIDLQNAISQELNEMRVGRVVEVLVEGPSKKDSMRYTGRTRQHWLVHFDVNDAMVTRYFNSLETPDPLIPLRESSNFYSVPRDLSELIHNPQIPKESRNERPKDLVGQFVNVRLDEAYMWGFVGTLQV